MLTFKLYVAVLLISLDCVLIDPTYSDTDVDVKYKSHPEPKPYPKPEPYPDQKKYGGIVSNAVNGNGKKYKVPGKPCKANIVVIALDYKNGKVVIVAIAKPGQSVFYLITKKYQLYIVYLEGLFVTIETYEGLINRRKVEGVTVAELIAYPANTRCGVQYEYTVNAIQKGDKPLFTLRNYKPGPYPRED